MKKNHNSKNYDTIANQCVTCGNEMPEGDHVCEGCRTSRAIYPHGLNVRVTTEQMAAIERTCILRNTGISKVVRGALDQWIAISSEVDKSEVDKLMGFDSRRGT